jgi:DNA-binding transcriptional LysR family regulator
MTAFTGMEIRHLVALRAVAEEGSFIGAADVLGLSQAAVSQQIAGLERMVGQQVFSRPGGPRPVRLTSAGKVLLRHADAVMEQLGRAERDLEDLVSEGRVTVGTFQSVSVQLLPEIVAAMRAKSPAIRIHALEADENEELIERLMDAETDVAFLASPVQDKRLELTSLGIDPYVVLVSASGPLASRAKARSFPAQALVGVPLIGQHGMEQQRHIDRGLREAGIPPRYVFRSRDNGAVQAMVRAGLGAAVLPALAVDAADPEVLIRPLDPPIPARTLFIALPKGDQPSPATRQLVSIAMRIGRRRLSQDHP